MKDNLNIEELFQDKFNAFEGEVSPDAWANIQQGMNAAGAASTGAATGMSLLMKGVIAGGIVAATITSIYVFSDTSVDDVTPNNDNVAINDPVLNNGNTTVIDNDPTHDNNLPENTIDGTDVNMEDNSSESVTQDANSQGDNTDSNTESGIIVTDGITSGSETEHSNGTLADGTNGSNGNGTEDNSSEGVDPISPISSPSSGTIERDPIVMPEISSNPSFKADNEYAPSTYTFTANTENARSVEWLFEDGTVKTGEEVVFTFEKPGTYQVTMTVYGDGQVDQEVLSVKVKGTSSINTLPNIITPNGDRKNDFFAISSTDIETFFIKISDLKGNVLFESTDVNFRWYGTNLGGEELPAGKYIYEFFAVGTDGSEIKKANELEIRMGL